MSGPVTLTGDAADMDTEAQATGLGYRAYLVRFACPRAPVARILFWTYAAYAGPSPDCDDLYEVGFRYELQVAANETAAAGLPRPRTRPASYLVSADEGRPGAA